MIKGQLARDTFRHSCGVAGKWFNLRVILVISRVYLRAPVTRPREKYGTWSQSRSIYARSLLSIIVTGPMRLLTRSAFGIHRTVIMRSLLTSLEISLLFANKSLLFATVKIQNGEKYLRTRGRIRLTLIEHYSLLKYVDVGVPCYFYYLKIKE